MKSIGFDIHGVIDSNPAFYKILIDTLRKDNWEVHIITGPSAEKVFPTLIEWGIKFDYFLSIEDYHKEKGTPITYDDKGNPWMDEITWNRTKGDYCKRMNIELHIDDSSKYLEYFKTPVALLKNHDEN